MNESLEIKYYTIKAFTKNPFLYSIVSGFVYWLSLTWILQAAFTIWKYQYIPKSALDLGEIINDVFHIDFNSEIATATLLFTCTHLILFFINFISYLIMKTSSKVWNYFQESGEAHLNLEFQPFSFFHNEWMFHFTLKKWDFQIDSFYFDALIFPLYLFLVHILLSDVIIFPWSILVIANGTIGWMLLYNLRIYTHKFFSKEKTTTEKTIIERSERRLLPLLAFFLVTICLPFVISKKSHSYLERKFRETTKRTLCVKSDDCTEINLILKRENELLVLKKNVPVWLNTMDYRSIHHYSNPSKR